jgi:hypothetical protein
MFEIALASSRLVNAIPISCRFLAHDPAYSSGHPASIRIEVAARSAFGGEQHTSEAQLSLGSTSMVSLYSFLDK